MERAAWGSEAALRNPVGLTDSPVGQLAWIVEKFKTWSGCGDDLESSFTKDELLDNVMVYWLNAAATSSARLYWHSLASSVGSFDEVRPPSAYSHFPAGNVALSERWARTRYTDLRYYGTPERVAISPSASLQPSSSPKCAPDSALWRESRSLTDAPRKRRLPQRIHNNG